MRYEMLGRLRIVTANGVHSIGAPKVETLCTALLIRANHGVSTHELLEELWGSEPPKRANAALHVYISQLRKLLRDPVTGESPIFTQAPGYVLHVEQGSLDVHEVQQLMNRGRSAERHGNYQAAADAYQSALDLWRGPAPEVSGGPLVTEFVRWIEETRVECMDRLISSGLAAGRHRELINPLITLIRQNPLHESFYEGLMLALHRSGRRGDALNVFRSARDSLRLELGLDPGVRLQALQRSILRGDALEPIRAVS